MPTIEYLANLQVCCRNRDHEFLDLRQARKDLFQNKDGQKTNYMDKRVCFMPTSSEKGTMRH